MLSPIFSSLTNFTWTSTFLSFSWSSRQIQFEIKNPMNSNLSSIFPHCRLVSWRESFSTIKTVKRSFRSFMALHKTMVKLIFSMEIILAWKIIRYTRENLIDISILLDRELRAIFSFGWLRFGGSLSSRRVIKPFFRCYLTGYQPNDEREIKANKIVIFFFLIDSVFK